MANYNFRLDLSKLSGFGKATLTGKSGQPKRCIVIPIEENQIFEGEKGCYLDIACFETPCNEYGSHRCVRSKSQKEQEHEKQTGERINTPILGNLKEFGGAKPADEYTAAGAAPAQRPAAAAPAPATQMPAAQENDDLPF